LWNFVLILQFYSGSILCWKNPKKFTKVLSFVVFTQLRRLVYKQITKGRYRTENPRPFFFGKLVLFTLGLGLTTSYSLGLLVWYFYQTFIIVCIEFWLRFKPQIRPKTFAMNFLFILVMAEWKVRLCVKFFYFFLGEYSSVWPDTCRVLSQIQ